MEHKNNQLQTVLSKLSNIKLQIESLEKVSQKNENTPNENETKDEILKLSIQMINTGIEAFANIKNIDNKYIPELSKITTELYKIIENNNINNTVKLFMYNMHDLNNFSPGMNPMNFNQFSPPLTPENPFKFYNANDYNVYNFEDQTIGEQGHIIFRQNDGQKLFIKTEIGMTICELITKYEKYVQIKDPTKNFYIYNAENIRRDDKRKIEEVFDLKKKNGNIMHVINKDHILIG